MATSAERKKMIAFLFIALLAGGEAIAVHEKVALHTGLMLVSRLFHNVAGMRPETEGDAQEVESAAPVVAYGCDNAIQVKLTPGSAEALIEVSDYVFAAGGSQNVFTVMTVEDHADCKTSYTVECKPGWIDWATYYAVVVVKPVESACNEAPASGPHYFYTLSYPKFNIPDTAKVTFSVGAVMGTIPVSEVSFVPVFSCERAKTGTEEAIVKVSAFLDSLSAEGSFSSANAMTELQGLEGGLTGFSRGISELTAQRCDGISALRFKMAGIAKKQYISYAMTAATDETEKQAAGEQADNQFEGVLEKIKGLGCDAAGCQFDQTKIAQLVEQLLLPEDPTATTTTVDQDPLKDLLEEQRKEINELMEAMKAEVPTDGQEMSLSESSSVEAVVNAVESIKPSPPTGEGTEALLQLDTRPVRAELQALTWLAIGINILFFSVAIILALTFFPAAFFIAVAFLAAFVTIMMNQQGSSGGRKKYRW